MRIAIVTTTSDSVINFRKKLIVMLKNSGYDVFVIASDNERRKDIEGLGFCFYCVNNKNRSISILGSLKYKKHLKNLFKKISPDIVFTFQIKPNIFGTLAAHASHVGSIFSMVEGVGDVFINNGLKWSVIRWIVIKLYSKAQLFSKKVFFLNSDDKNDFIRYGIVKECQCVVVPGIGVDVNFFSFKPLQNYNSFIMIARMIKTKGVIDYCKCARIVKRSHPNALFYYLGGEGNLKIADIQQYIDDNSIKYIGKVGDVRPFIEKSAVLVLPSFREGFPVSVMEAEAIGRGVITTNTVGCKETVRDGYNGFLVEINHPEMMAEKCLYLLNHPETITKFSCNARRFAEEQFNCTKINQAIISVIENKKE